MGWMSNALMQWSADSTDGSGGTWKKVTDHNRSALSVSYERFGTDNRTVNATLRRYSVAKKRDFSCSWTMLPSHTINNTLQPVDGGTSGSDIETFYMDNDGPFYVKFYDGRGNSELVRVMITDFSKAVVKRGKVDFWDLDITLSEV